MSKVKIQGNASGTGVLTIAAPNTSTDRTITLPDSTGTILDNTSTLDATKLSGNLPAISGASLTNVNSVNSGRKNLIINGDMVVNQRGGTATINATGVTYNVDRWLGRGVSSAGVFTLVQSSSSCPDFRKALAATVTTADSSIASNSSYRLQQFIEGQNMMHLNWGNSNAKSITLSFWVLSTGPTGTFGGSIANNDYNRFNPFSYSISAANTYEKKTITISGDTSGNWETNNHIGMRVNFSLGAGSSKVGTAGTWTSSSYEGVTGQTNLIATNGAALYITGVQVEQGSTATDFEHRSYGEELALCQRYYTFFKDGMGYFAGNGVGSSRIDVGFPLSVPLRATPSIQNTGVRMHRSGNESATANQVSVGEYDAYGSAIKLICQGFSVSDETAYTVRVNVADLELDAEM